MLLSWKPWNKNLLPPPPSPAEFPNQVYLYLCAQMEQQGSHTKIIVLGQTCKLCPCKDTYDWDSFLRQPRFVFNDRQAAGRQPISSTTYSLPYNLFDIWSSPRLTEVVHCLRCRPVGLKCMRRASGTPTWNHQQCQVHAKFFWCWCWWRWWRIHQVYEIIADDQLFQSAHLSDVQADSCKL